LGGGVSTYGYGFAAPLTRSDQYGLSPGAVGQAVIVGAIKGCATGCLAAALGDYAKCTATGRLTSDKTLGECSDECTPDPCQFLKNCISGCIAGAIVGGATGGFSNALPPVAGFVLRDYFKFLFAPDFCKKYGVPNPAQPKPIPLPDWLYSL
jgi:hypothetical protein